MSSTKITKTFFVEPLLEKQNQMRNALSDAAYIALFDYRQGYCDLSQYSWLSRVEDEVAALKEIEN